MSVEAGLGVTPSPRRGQERDHIVIPSDFAPSKVETIEVKEILTPTWQSGVPVSQAKVLPISQHVVEDTSDEAYLVRHKVLEIKERERFSCYLTIRKRKRSGEDVIAGAGGALASSGVVGANNATAAAVAGVVAGVGVGVGVSGVNGGDTAAQSPQPSPVAGGDAGGIANNDRELRASSRRDSTPSPSPLTQSGGLNNSRHHHHNGTITNSTNSTNNSTNNNNNNGANPLANGGGGDVGWPPRNFPLHPRELSSIELQEERMQEERERFLRASDLETTPHHGGGRDSKRTAVRASPPV